MKHNWEKKRIGDFVHQSENFVELIPAEQYSLLGMSLEGRGLFVREKKIGSEIGSRSLNKVVAGEFIYSRLFAWKGAFDFVKDDFEGCYVSDEYPTFIVDEKKVDVKFLNYYFNQSKVWKEVEQYCIGVTKASRNRFKEKFFLNFEINLPSIKEQHRIISKIESVKTKLELIKELRAEQELDIKNLRNSIFIDLQTEFENIPIGKVLVPNRKMVQLNPEADYKQVTVRMEHKGLLLRGSIKGSEIGSTQFFARKNNFIISKIDARNGAMGMIPSELDGAVVTNDFPLFGFTEEVNPKFFYYFSNTLYFDNACKKASEGTTNRRRLKMDKFANILMPLPPIEEQNRFVSLLDKLNEVKVNHKQTEKELNELMPSLLDKAFKGSYKKSGQSLNPKNQGSDK